MFISRKVCWVALLLLTMAGAILIAAEPNEKQEYDARYESWRLSQSGDAVIYKLAGAENEPDRMEITITERTLDRISFITRTYQGERLVEEKPGRISFADMTRQFYPSELKQQGIEFSKASEIISGTARSVQKFAKDDGSYEIFSEKIPAGGLIRKVDASGKTLQELIESRSSKLGGSAVSQIKKETPKPSSFDRKPLSISDLRDEVRRDKTESAKIVISRDAAQAVKTQTALSFLEEVQQDKGQPTKRFLDNPPLLAFGFDRIRARARYFLTKSTEPAAEQTPEETQPYIATFQSYLYHKGNPKPARARFIIIEDDKTTSPTVDLESPFMPDMKPFELPPEAVTILPGTFNCFRVRLVSANPTTAVKKEGNNQITTITDKKIDYWITNVMDCTVVVKKIETEKVRQTVAPVEDITAVISSEVVTHIKKWILEEFSPTGK